MLGAAGSFLDPASDAPCSGYLLQMNTSSLLLDCGYGVLVNAYKYVDLAALDGIFLSHIHPDHCADIFNLNGYLHRHPATGIIDVLCPEQARLLLDGYVERWAPSLRWTDITRQSHCRVGEFLLRFSRTIHGPPTFACQVQVGRATVIYTSDTGPGWSPDAFASNPDLLICDAAYMNAKQGPAVHLTALQAGELARHCGARTLLLTHMYSGADRDRIEKDARAEFDGVVAVAVPGLQLTIDT